jgi:protein-S-isoprenylcysteine O-methyltransferase Ste14
MSSFPAAGQSGAVSAESTVARIQAFAFRHRNLLAALPVVVSFVAVRQPVGPEALVTGATLALLGAALRAWCTLYNRFAQGERKTLATAGPYAWLRNPLYVGNTLVLSGCALAAGPLWLLPLTGAWALGVYDQVVRHEERRLFEKYGEAYREYARGVRRWIPRLSLDAFAPQRGFLRALLVQSRSLLALLPFAAKTWALAAWPLV